MWQIEIKIRHNFQIPILSSLYKFIIYRTNIGTGFVQIDSIEDYLIYSTSILKNNPQKLRYLFLFITRILSHDVIILFRLNEICTRCVTVFK